MATLPTPLRAALGLAATALEEARKLPETLPQAPVVAVSTAMQLSLRVQQRIAELAARGDEVLSQLRGTSSEPPQWATFDEAPDPAPHNGSSQGLAAFDRVSEGSASDSEFDVAETGASRPTTETRPASETTPATAKPTLAAAAEPTIAPVKASRTRAAKAETAKAARAKTASTKAAPATKPAGTKATKTTSAKATKPAGPKSATVKGKPAKRARIVSEPLAEAANRAQPSEAPNPATMAAEIVRAHQAADETTPAQPGTE